MEISKDVAERLLRALAALDLLASDQGEAGANIAAQAEDLIREVQAAQEASPPEPGDPRIVRQVGKLRVVATRARLESRWTRYLNGALLIEKRETDSLGAERWVEVGGLVWKEASTLERALFRLLAGDGWADRELSEYDRG